MWSKKLFSILALCILLPMCINAQATKVLTGLEYPGSLVVHNDSLYITEWESGRILRIDLNEPDPEIDTIITNLKNQVGPVFYKGYLFVSQVDKGVISKINLNQPPPPLSPNFYQASKALEIY